MIMSYTLLVFEPDIKHHPSAENVLWKGQVIPPSNYSSIMLILLQDILELNNRRTIQEWERILRDNSFKHTLNYDHEFCREYIIEDKPLIAYSFQLFMCDLQDGTNKLEVTDEYILPILFSLNISKNKSYNPVALKKRIETALELISISDPKPLNLMMIGQLNLLDKLTDVCIDYEVDVKCTIEVRA
jgi:hypothetical protein